MKERKGEKGLGWVRLGWVAFDSAQDLIRSKTKTKHGKQKKRLPIPKAGRDQNNGILTHTIPVIITKKDRKTNI